MSEIKHGGALFKNEKKTTDQHPDYTGKIVIEGTEYYLSAWVNTMQSTGQKYMSLRATPKAATTPATTPAPAQPRPGVVVVDPVDDLPF